MMEKSFLKFGIHDSEQTKFGMWKAMLVTQFGKFILKYVAEGRIYLIKLCDDIKKSRNRRRHLGVWGQSLQPQRNFCYFKVKNIEF